MREPMRSFTFEVNGYPIEAVYSDHFLNEIAMVLIDRWRTLAQQTHQRVVVFLAAPPAAGKSTMALLFERLSQADGGKRIQALGMDGFHHRQSYILSHSVEVDGKLVTMKEVKGCPESFDFERLHRYIRRLKQEASLKWPLYDRRLHDVVEDAITVTEDIVLLEGNYLLLDEPPWNVLASYCDDALFISAKEEQVRQRLISRKLMGGMPLHAALAFCERSDLRNVRRILHSVVEGAVTLVLEEGDYRLSRGK